MTERIQITNSKVEGTLRAFKWKDHGSFIIQIPSLNMSAYGGTLRESEEMMDEVVKDLCEMLLSLKKSDLNNYLAQYGFHQEKLTRKKYSKTYIDKEGVLKNLFKDEGSFEEVEEHLLTI